MNTKYKVAWKAYDTAIYMDDCDCRYAAKNGTLAWRINNPGLLSYRSHFAKKNGSIGS